MTHTRPDSYAAARWICCVLAVVCMTALAAEPRTIAAGFAIRCRRTDDRVAIVTEGDAVIVDVVSPFGISNATITRKEPKWPDSMILRLHLGGLEGLSVVSGTQTLSASAQSHGEFTRRVQWTSDHVEPLDPGLLKAFTADGQPTDKLPGKGGWFELTIPAGMLSPADSKLEIHWIDFYR